MGTPAPLNFSDTADPDPRLILPACGMDKLAMADRHSHMHDPLLRFSEENQIACFERITIYRLKTRIQYLLLGIPLELDADLMVKHLNKSGAIIAKT